MKKIYFPMLLAMILATSCQTKTTPVAFDPVTAKAEVTKTLKDMDESFRSKDAKAYLSFFTEDGLYCGTDPAELWDKAGYTKVITTMMADTMKFKEPKFEKIEIRFNKEGNSANVLRQFVTGWSKPIQVRDVMHFVKVDNKWMIDFSTFALIPENKDLPKLAAVVK
ncbi:MAG: nuclear transport factor 2 family protein [Bacteroidota bacterium]|nr:nuclear transport factor 2 family protein [Bacteroidota bacterium]